MPLAKTTRPALATTVARPRLFRLLDRARRQPVTWVWGPPGAGKTTLVASYLRSRKVRALWYQLDEGDDDVATFFYYLGLAAPRRRRPLPLLTSPFRPGLSIFVRHYFRELYGRLPAHFTVVFDNYQDVPAESRLHDLLAEAITEIPAGGRLVFISRSEPPAAFARHRAHGKIDVVDGAQLRFNPAEAGDLIRRLAPGRWSRETLRSLHESVDGWGAGLVLRLEQLRQEPRTSAGPVEPSSDLLFDYLAAEIFKKADVARQDVLLQTAFLPRITPSMAASLTGQSTAGAILADLHRGNYFTNKQAGREPTYEFHPLFREFLLSQAARTYPPARLATIRRTAADLLDGAGQVEAAAGLLVDAEDWAGLAQLIHRNAQKLLAQGRAQTLEEWLERIPAALFAEQPWLLVWRGVGWLAWHHAECQRDLERAFAAFREQQDTLGMFVAWSGIVLAYLSEGESLPLDRWIAVLDEMMPDAESLSKGAETRVAVAMLSAIAWRQPHHPRAAEWARRAFELARRHPDRNLQAISAAHWLYYQLEAGELSEAAIVVNEMRALMSTRDASPVVVVNASVPVIWWESLNALPSYRQTVSRVLDLTLTTGMFYTARHVALSAGLVGALSDADLDTASPWLREFARDVHLLGPGFRFWYQSFVVWEALIRKDVASAARAVPELLRLSAASGRPLDEAVACLLSIQVCHAGGQAREARAHLDRALEIAHAIHSFYIEFMARLAEAQLDLDGGREADGLQALAAAMALGREHGYLSSHVWVPEIMARLCSRALEAGIEVDYVRALVQKRRLLADGLSVTTEAWPWPIKIFTLGRFELLRSDKPIQFSRKVQRKPLALLKALIAFGGRRVRESLLMDALWPDAEGDAARVALASALHRLRALMGSERAIVRQEGQLSLDARSCWVDVWAVERLLGRAEAGQTESLRKAVDLYRGVFLDEQEVELPQAAALADTLRRRLLRQIARAARQCDENDWPQAVDWYEHALRVDPCAEDVCRSLMKAYHALGRPAEVAESYRRCRAALAAIRGTRPSPETEGLLKALSPSSA
jgi:ATP/maltotriose-dependent transcriptional regulator MalT/DNA-binding SARP family transcriptional activator